MKKFEILISSIVTIEIDETKITDEMLKDFSEYMYSLDNLEDAVVDLAEKVAMGDIECNKYHQQFIEGYGDSFDLKLSTDYNLASSEIISEENI